MKLGDIVTINEPDYEHHGRQGRLVQLGPCQAHPFVLELVGGEDDGMRVATVAVEVIDE